MTVKEALEKEITAREAAWASAGKEFGSLIKERDSLSQAEEKLRAELNAVGVKLRILDESPDWAKAKKATDAFYVPVADARKCRKFVRLYSILREHKMNHVPAAALSVVGGFVPDIVSELGTLFPSGSEDRDHARITKKVQAEIETAFSILRTVSP